MAALLGAGGGGGGSDARGRLQVLSVKSSAGWAFELALRPGGDADLYERYSIAEYLQVTRLFGYLRALRAAVWASRAQNQQTTQHPHPHRLKMIKDNLYVLAAALRDEHVIALEEDASARPSCAACRRACFAVTLERRYF
jgi:hypothetical protein